MNVFEYYSYEKWKGLTNLTQNHVRLSSYALQILKNYHALPEWIYNNPKINKVKIFDNEYECKDISPFFDACMTYNNMLRASYLADLEDKGVIERRVNHANVFGFEWERNFRDKHREIEKHIDRGDDTSTILLETAWNVHYIQDALSPMHTHPYFQQYHIQFEHFIDDNAFWNSIIKEIIYRLLKNIVLIQDVDSLINYVREQRYIVSINGVKAVMDYINRYKNINVGKVFRRSLERGVSIIASYSIIATFNYYLIILDMVR